MAATNSFMACVSPVMGSKMSTVSPARSTLTHVGLAHRWAHALLPGLEGHAKPRMAKAVGFGRAILFPQHKRVTLRRRNSFST